jgi:MarR family transcriptional regulator, organic hydroperoxide resistance regulator
MARSSRREALERDAFVMTTLLADRLSHEIGAVCRSEGISEQQYRVLWVLCLSSSDEGLPLGAISDGLITRASDVSRLVDRLERAGLVERRSSETDRRVVLVSATTTGGAVFERVTKGIKALHAEQWGSLDDDHLRELLGLLNEVFWTDRASDGEGAS